MALSDPFRSTRLIYRAVEPSEDEPFLLTLQQDPIAWANSNAAIPRPQGKKGAQQYIKDLEEAMLGVVICLPPQSHTEKPIPIGAIFLNKDSEAMRHHRTTSIAIDITKPYQNQGYGSEAIYWILDWAFETAGLHRVSISCFSWNEGARRLYGRLGFREEGVRKEMVWCRGKWWDDVQFAILEGEWRDMQKGKEGKGEVVVR